MMAKQAAALVAVMVAYVARRIRRSSPKPDPLLYHLRSDAEQHRQQTLQAIYKSTDVECLFMIRMTKAPFFLLCVIFLDKGALYQRSLGALLRSR
jgi:hypothetical protein